MSEMVVFTTLLRLQAPCLSLSVRGTLEETEKRTDVVVEAQKCAAELFFSLHDDPDSRANAFVDELCRG
jgi:hypothetical protein